jgi:cobalt-zinc-cadmium efflux system protein
VPGVVAVHDLHVWSITTGLDNLSAHVVVEDARDGPAVVRRIRDQLRQDHRLQHVTIEVEADDSECVGCN